MGRVRLRAGMLGTLASVVVANGCWKSDAPTTGAVDQKAAHAEAHAIVGRAFTVEEAERYAELNRVSLTQRGLITQPVQAYSLIGQPSPDEDETFIGHWFVDLENERVREYTRRLYHGGHDLRFETLFADGRRFDVTTQMRRYEQRAGSFENAVDILAHYPGFVLARAAGRLGTLTDVGEATVAGAVAHVVEFTWSPGSRRRLYIDGASGRLLQITWLAPDGLVGDREVRVRYHGRRNAGGYPLPDSVETFVEGVRWQVRYLTRFDPDPTWPDDLFTLEADLRPFEPDAPAPWHVRSVAGPVSQIQSLGAYLYTVPFVEFPTFVLVYDAILAEGVSRRAIHLIKERTGDKPIRYVVLSHHHTDHIGGVRAYAEEGATIVSSREADALVSSFLSAPRSRLSSLAVERTATDTERIQVSPGGEHVISEGDVRVRIRNLGATPHVNELLVLELADPKVFVQADMFFEFSPDGAIFEFLRDLIREEDLRDHTVLGTHHRPRTGAEILRAGGQAGVVPAYLRLLGLPGS